MTSGNLSVKAKEDSTTGQLTYDFKLANTVNIGEAGEAGNIIINNSNGDQTIGIDGENGTIGMNGKDGSSATLGVEKGDPGVNGKDGDTMDRIKYVDSNGDPHQVATLDDGVNSIFERDCN